MSQDHDAKIRAIAHRLWEEEGRPEGRSSAHWEQAEAMVTAAQAKPKAAAAKKPAAKAPAAKAPAKAKTTAPAKPRAKA